MTALRIVAVNGSLSANSRTGVLIEALLKSLAPRIGAHTPHLIEVSQLGEDLGSSLDFTRIRSTVADAISRIENADLLVVASPIYKGTYTGLFKHLFDLVGQDSLIGKPVLLAATGGSDRHSLAIDHSFRPLFSFFRTHTVPSGVYAGPNDFQEKLLGSGPIRTRIEEATAQAALFVKKRAAAKVAEDYHDFELEK